MLSCSKKRQMRNASTIGLAIGFFMFMLFYSVTDSLVSLAIIPVTGAIGAAQAYLAPDYDQKE
ncbi:MAG: hypothetical protein WCR24_00405 [Candidatus Methanomethylophilaceae archaeon]